MNTGEISGGYTLGLIAGEERIVDQAAPVFQVDALEDVYVTGRTGDLIPLRSLVTITRSAGPAVLARTDALVIVGHGAAAETVAADIAAQGKPVLRAHLKPDDVSVASLRGKRVLAFAGIGDPNRFFDTLRSSGVEVVQGRAFADHHWFSRREIESLSAEAKRDALIAVTTEKDLARLRSGEGLPPWARDIVPFAVTLEFDDAALLRKFVTDRLFKARDRKFR